MNTFKMIKNFLIRYHKRLLSAVIVVVFGFVLLASSLYNVKLEDGSYKKDDWTSAPYVASTYTEQSSVSDNGITTEQSAQELWDKMIEEGSNIEDYLDTPEELEKLMNAEIITQYPKIGKDNLDGIIQFERHKTDGTSNMLTYIDNETFNSYINSGDKDVFDYFTLDDQNNALVAVENTTTDIITSNDEEMDISEYTQNLDESNKKSDGNYEKIDSIITTVPIYYKNVVQKYTMPFQYLWALLVIGEDKDFVLELADLVEGSEITISIYDNITTTVNKDEYIYYKETRTDTCVRLSIPRTFGVTKIPSERYWVSEDNEHYNSKYPADYSKDEETEYKITHTTTYENNRPIVDLTKANVWIVDYSKEYTYQSSKSVSEESNTKSLEDTEWKLKDEQTTPEDSSLYENAHAKDLKAEAKKYIEDHRTSSSSSSGSTTAGIAGEFANALNGDNIDTKEEQEEVVVNIAHVDTKTYKHETDRKQTTSYSQSEQKYIAQTPINNPKVDKNSNEDNFVTILCKKSHKGAKKLIALEVSDWLFEILETNTDTVNMVDLTKYLLYKVTGRNYGITEYDFSEYANNSFNTLGISVSSNILFDYLASWENTAVWKYLRGEVGYSNYLSKYITEDKSEYICYADLSNTRNFGFGVCHTADNGQSYWHISEYQEEGVSINTGQYDTVGVSKLSTNVVDSVKEKLLNAYQQSIKNQLSNAGILDEFEQSQIDALTCIMYQYGNIGNFVDAYKNYGNTNELVTHAKSNSGKTYFNSNVESNGRSQANWKLFHEGIYTAGTGEELSTSNYSGGGKVLEIASQIWKLVCTSGNFTNYGGIGSIPSNGPSIDCSGFVSWVLYECGFTEEFYYQHDTSSFLNTNWNSRYGWEEIQIASGENPYDKLQPGDILVRNEGSVHHMNIVVELKDGKLYAYDCGSKNSWLNNTNAAPVDRSYFLTSRAKGKIIRITQ